MPKPGARITAASSFPQAPPWWRTAVVYQVYIRSFADGDGDGLGDLAGLRAHLGHLSGLGVDAIWINPWYPSPMNDAGYDVADYRAIEPVFGTLADAEALIAEAHAVGLRVLLDIVPNHTSSAHVWFEAALDGDLAARARYVFRPGRGESGSEPPNDWQSSFGGPAWTRTKDRDGRPGEWYLHLFAPEQPDLDWTNSEVRAEFEDILRFWFDRDVDGFRIDVAHGLVKASGLPDFNGTDPTAALGGDLHPAWDQDGVHDIYRSWRAIADSYDPPRIFVGEAWVADNERLARYLRHDELHSAFQFDFLRAPWRADHLRQVAEDAMATAETVGAASTWVLANHDVVRHVTRYARPQPDHLVDSEQVRQRWDEPADLHRGTRRARAAAMLVLALPGVAYIYQGDELGLEEVEDLPGEFRQDPTWWQSGHSDPGRDGCRVPLPWSGETVPFGFSPDGAASAPWLPQPEHWAELSVEHQDLDPESMLNLYRSALRLRHEYLRGDDAVAWIDSPTGTLAFRRGDVECWVNTGWDPVSLPDGEQLLCSDPRATKGELPVDATAWVVVT